MSSAAPCGLANCPVPAPVDALTRRLRTTVIPAGSRLRRGRRLVHTDPIALVPGLGDTRFAPLPGVAHVYLAATTFAALLESAFHDTAPPAPRIPEAVLRLWAEDAVDLRADVRLIDLRDGELARLGLERGQLVATSAAHYPCTRRWAAALHGRRIGGQQTHGLIWHSRQTELHARALSSRPALRELVDEHPADVAVVWSPPAARRLLAPSADGLGLLATGPGRHYIDDLVALLSIVSQ
ncbi:MAG: RES family NAD+ phosphorylase [Haloechinothrix sp.]